MRLSGIGLVLTFALGLLAGAPPAEAQRAPKVYRIGFLSTHAAIALMLDGFLRGLRDLGWVEGENIVLEYRSAEENHGRLADFAAELVRLKVDVIVAPRTPTALAAKNATSTIPIVMVWVADPVGSGLVASLAQPGGNVTGLTNILPALSGKQLEFLREMVPGISRVAVLWDPTHPGNQLVFRQTQVAAQALGVTLQSVEVANLEPTALWEPAPGKLESAFSAMTRGRADALMVVLSGVMFRYQVRIADLALEHRLPMTSNSLWLTEHGGLMSYLPSAAPMFRRAATYVHKILKGTNPADLPIEQPTKFDLAINMKTARALGLTVPDSVLYRADRLIE